MGKGFRCFSFALIGVALILAGTSTAWAHTDPPGATATGVGFSLSAFRADGVTPVFPGRVTQCETIIYRATLSYNTSTVNGINAAFQNGTITITTPDGIVHPATPASIPCIGGTVAPCDPTVQSVNSLDVPFNVATALPGLDCTTTPTLIASASYSGGDAHIGTNDIIGVVSGGSGFNAGTDCCADDGLACNGIVHCDPAVSGQFCGSPTAGTVCDANNTGGDGVIHSGTCVAGTPVPCNDDGNVCNGPEHCTEPGGLCVSGPPLDCTTADKCDVESCDPLQGCKSTPVVCTQDANLCNTEACDPADGACKSGPDKICDDPVCTACTPASGNCEAILPAPPGCVPSNVICRTPGFWGTHAGTEKSGSHNITQAVLDEIQPLTICGHLVSTTDLTNTSAVEAICVSPKGDSTLQLARQLTAAALNCGVTNSTSCGGGGQTAGDVCSGVDAIADVFNACNTACANGEVTATVDSTTFNCIDALDCFNNGGTGLDEFGVCTGDSGCHERPLVNGCFSCPGSNCFEPPGPAGSPRECNDARKDNCTIFCSVACSNLVACP
ncbi:MAG TPA: hypothetical protein VGK86_07245 [Thermoanaerobaculia bacterium]|jgi:hypothetical protein